MNFVQHGLRGSGWDTFAGELGNGMGRLATLVRCLHQSLWTLRS